MIHEQAVLQTIGAEGCYLLSLKKGAEIFNQGDSDHDILKLYIQLTTEKIGTDRIMEKDCYMNWPDIALGIMTGVRWKVLRGPGDYKPEHGEVVIARYEWQTLNKLMSHFVLLLEDGTLYDPLGWSNSVANGKRVSTRIFRRV